MALVAGLLPQIAGVLAATFPHASPDSFVTRDGAQLVLEGHPYRFSGANIYNANSIGQCGYAYTDQELADAFDALGPASDTTEAHADGAVVRAWFFQTFAASRAPGTDGRAFAGDRDWTAFDRTLRIAREHGVRIMATLTDFASECGDNIQDGQNRKSADWFRAGYTVPDPKMVEAGGDHGYNHWVAYRDWVAEVADRYQDDATIMAWQLINEGEVKNEGEAACPADANFVLRTWADDVSTVIRQADPRHLISVGTIGSGQCGASGQTEYTAVHNLPTIDLCEFHDHNPTDLVPGDSSNGLQRRIDDCAADGKPLFVGEIGFTAAQVDGTYAGRAQRMREKLGAQSAAGVVGHLVWLYNQRAPGADLNGDPLSPEAALGLEDVGPGDPMLVELARDRVQAPDPPTNVHASPRDSGACVTWDMPLRDGGSAVTGLALIVQQRPGVIDLGGPGSEVCIGGLENGETYSFVMTASNTPGDGRVLTSNPSTASNPVMPGQTPGPSISVVATGGDQQVTVTWQPPEVGDPPTGYRIVLIKGDPNASPTPHATPRPGTTPPPEGPQQVVDSTTTSVTFTGLQNGATYFARVVAFNPVGDGPAVLSNAVTLSPGTSQTITFAGIADRTMLPASFTLNPLPTATSGLTVTVSSQTPGICSASGFAITLVSAGMCTLAADQGGDSTFAAAPTVTQTFRVSRVDQTITFPTITGKTIADLPFAPPATVSSNLPVTYVSSTPSVCTDGVRITLIALGTCTVRAAQAGNAVYNPVTSMTRSFAVAKGDQQITFQNPGLHTLAESPFPIDPAPFTKSPLTVSVTSTTTPVCTVSGLQVTLKTVGTCSLTATQPGDSLWNAATPVSRGFRVTQASQTITFQPGLPDRTLVAPPFTVSATIDSPLAVIFTTANTAICTASGPHGSTISVVATGTCTVRANQPGNVIYAAAQQRTQSFVITKAPQTVAFTLPSSRALAQSPFTASATASSGLLVTFSSTTGAICTATGTRGRTITLLRTGTCTIRAAQAGDATYKAAKNVDVTFTVTPVGFVTAVGDHLALDGRPFTFHGAAIYQTSTHGATANPVQIFAWASQAGLNSVRLVNMFDETGVDPNAPTNPTDWARIDALIARARDNNMRVVLDLSAYRNFLVNRAFRVNGYVHECDSGVPRTPGLYAALDPYQPSLYSGWQTFLTFVLNRKNTVNGVVYKNDPTIAVISLAGEPQPSDSEECGKVQSPQELLDFYRSMLDFLASKDPKHLHSTGGLTHTNMAIPGHAIFDLASNTLPSIHTYPDERNNDANGNPTDAQQADLGAYARSIGKPWFTEEFGWLQSVGDSTRAGYYEWLYDQAAALGSDGSLFWNLGPEVAGGSHDANPSTPATWEVARAHAPSP